MPDVFAKIRSITSFRGEDGLLNRFNREVLGLEQALELWRSPLNVYLPRAFCHWKSDGSGGADVNVAKGCSMEVDSTWVKVSFERPFASANDVIVAYGAPNDASRALIPQSQTVTASEIEVIIIRDNGSSVDASADSEFEFTAIFCGELA